jgi:hypothetical protein
MNIDRPRIRIMGEHGMEEVPWEEAPAAPALELEDHFRPVKLTITAINQASKIVPVEAWKAYGICKWLQKAADIVFSKLPSDKMEGKLGLMRYFFEFDADGPVLTKVSL